MNHILVIDDEIDTCNLLRDILNKEDYVVSTATSIKEARRILEKRKINLIVSDVYLGDEYGLDIIKDAKEKDPEIPVVMVSAYGTQDKVVEALELGAADFIAKPFIPRNIIAAIKRVQKLNKLSPEERQRKATEFSPLRRLLEDSYISILRSLAVIVESKDPYLQEHSLRVTKYAVLLARETGLNDEEIEVIAQTGRFHDIGKIGVSDKILQKPGPLTPGERDQIEQHPIIGFNIVEPLKLLHIALPGIRHHHERFDGSGYPDGLKGKDIPISARIMAIADAYEALTADRPYRKGRSHEEAIEELQKCAGTQFDPEYVEKFIVVITRTREAEDKNNNQGG